jgi:hypothetical protein
MNNWILWAGVETDSVANCGKCPNQNVRLNLMVLSGPFKYINAVIVAVNHMVQS